MTVRNETSPGSTSAAPSARRPGSRRVVTRIVWLLLGIHTGLLAWSARVHSPVTDEPGQLVGGLSHWQFNRFEIYRVTGPLVRLVGAVPVLCAGYEMDWSGFHDFPGSRAEVRLGQTFCEANGPRTFHLMTLARLACIPFSLLGGYVCFRWARELFGSPAGLLALTLWCFSPTVLGNAPLVMTDVPGAALFLTAGYLFRGWLKEPVWERVFFAGLTFGLLLLTKATFIIVFGLWPLLWLVCRWRVVSGIRFRRLRELTQLTGILLLGVYVLNLGYGFEGSLKPLGEYQFVSRSLAGTGIQALAESGNRFHGTWMESLPVPLPENFVRGVDTQRRYFERTLRSYLRGEWKDGGWWYYYLYALSIKVPLGTLLIVVLAIVVTVRPVSASGDDSGRATRSLPQIHLSGWREEVLLLVPLLAVLYLVSSQTGFNKNSRYVLPVLPLLFVWSSRIAQSAVLQQKTLAVTGTAALCWSVSSSLWVYPHSLSYFNEVAGGPRHGHEHLIHTNIDFGQDLLYLRDWLAEHAAGRSVSVACYGAVDPRIAGIEYTLPNPLQGRIRRRGAGAGTLEQSGPYPGLQAVSINLIRGHHWPVPDGTGNRRGNRPDDYSYFLEFEPVALAGYSIYIYDISLADAERVRRRLGLPSLIAVDSRGNPGEPPLRTDTEAASGRLASG